MAKDESSGQYAAKLLTLFAALVGGGTVQIADEASSVEVVGITRDNWPGASLFVSYVTADGRQTRVIEDFEIRD